MSRNGAPGFTLLELLVTLVVLGVLMVTLTQGIRFGLRARDMEIRAGSGMSDLEATSRLLRGLVARALPGDPSGRDAMFTGAAHALSFVTILPEGLRATANGEADVSLGVEAGHHLVLRWRPHYRRWIVAQPPFRTETLLDGVERLDLCFWQPRPEAAGWVTDWSAPDPPKLVRLRVVFPAGDGRHWPDIVTAPMREFPRP